VAVGRGEGVTVGLGGAAESTVCHAKMTPATERRRMIGMRRRSFTVSI
jgi:hypothetical protein